MPFSLMFVRPALVDGQTEGIADSTQTVGAEIAQTGGQIGATGVVKTAQATVWGQDEFLSHASRFLDGVLPVVVAGKAKRLSQSNAGLDKSRRLIAELSPGTIVLMKNEDMVYWMGFEPTYSRALSPMVTT